MDTGRLRLLYRADGGNAVGTGHLLRAVRVLTVLSELGTIDAELAVSEDPSGLSYARRADAPLLILPRGHARGPKPRFDPDQLARSADLSTYDAVVVDMLDTEAGTLAYVAGFGPRVITLDDRGEGRVDADGIINFLVRESDRASLRNGTMLWEGPEYATLDPAFETPPPPGRDASTSRATLLVSVGGGDAAGLSLKIARALTALPGIAVVTFVCGAASGRAEQLGSIVKSAPWRGRVLCDLPNLREALLACDLAIVAGGMTMHEACCTGTPALAVCQPIDHQIELARWFDEAGAMRTLGDGTRASEGDITRATRCLLADGEKLRQMSEAGPRLVDGRGTSRTAAAITAAARRVRTGGQG